MEEYISRRKIREAINVDGYQHFSGCLTSSEVSLLEMVDECICQAEAEDVVPVVHGKWKDTKERATICSNCNTYFQAYYSDYQYCPRCGCKMDGVIC